MVDLHPMKQETFDVSAKTNTDPKGYLRQVDTYRTTDFGLYMARGADHPKFGYLESWLIPALRLRANIFHYRPNVEKQEDYYFDIAHISQQGAQWHTQDLYVDLISLNNAPIQVVDIDELAAATSAGLITAEDAEQAIESTLSAVEGITRYQDDPMQWLASKGIVLEWAQEVTLTPLP